MLRTIILSTTGVLILGLFGFREWSILKEIESLESDLTQELSLQLERANDFRRLGKVSESDFVYERFLEPVLLNANRLIWPPFRSQKILSWERKVHQTIGDSTYEKRHDLRTQIEDQIASLRLEKNPGKERMIEVTEISQKLDNEKDRMEFLQMELADIQKQAELADQELVKQIQKTGVDRLKALGREIKTFEDPELVDYIASADFFKGIMEPVSQLILQIKQESLRAKTWNEFQKNLGRVLSRKKRQLAKVRPEEGGSDRPADELEGLAELLQREYEREKRRELSYDDSHSEAVETQDLN